MQSWPNYRLVSLCSILIPFTGVLCLRHLTVVYSWGCNVPNITAMWGWDSADYNCLYQTTSRYYLLKPVTVADWKAGGGGKDLTICLKFLADPPQQWCLITAVLPKPASLLNPLRDMNSSWIVLPSKRPGSTSLDSDILKSHLCFLSPRDRGYFVQLFLGYLNALFVFFHLSDSDVTNPYIKFTLLKYPVNFRVT